MHKKNEHKIEVSNLNILSTMYLYCKEVYTLFTLARRPSN